MLQSPPQGDATPLGAAQSLLRQGHLQKVSNSLLGRVSACRLYLFTNFVVWADMKKKIKGQIDLSELVISPETNGKPSSHFVLLGKNGVQVEFAARSDDHRADWIQAISAACEARKATMSRVPGSAGILEDLSAPLRRLSYSDSPFPENGALDSDSDSSLDPLPETLFDPTEIPSFSSSACPVFESFSSLSTHSSTSSSSSSSTASSSTSSSSKAIAPPSIPPGACSPHTSQGSSSKLSSAHLAARELAITDRVSISSISPKRASLDNGSSLGGSSSPALTPPSRRSRLPKLSPPIASSSPLRPSRLANFPDMNQTKSVNPPSSKRRPKPPDLDVDPHLSPELRSKNNSGKKSTKNRPVVVHGARSARMAAHTPSPKKDYYSGGDEKSDAGSPVKPPTARKALFRDDVSADRDSRTSRRSLDFDENEPMTLREKQLKEERDGAVAELLAAQAMNDLLEDQVRSLYQLEVDAVAERNRIASNLEQLEIKYARLLVLLQESDSKHRLSTTLADYQHSTGDSTISSAPKKERKKRSASKNRRITALVPVAPTSAPSSPEGPQPDENLPILPFIRLSTPRVNLSISDTPQPPTCSSSFSGFSNQTQSSSGGKYLPSDSVELPSSFKLSRMMQSALLENPESPIASSSSPSYRVSRGNNQSATSCIFSEKPTVLISPSCHCSSSSSSASSSSSPMSYHDATYHSMFVPRGLQELNDWLEQLRRNNPNNKSQYAGDFHHSYLPAFIPTSEDLDQIHLWEKLRTHEASRHDSSSRTNHKLRKKRDKNKAKSSLLSPSLVQDNETKSLISPNFYPPSTVAGPSGIFSPLIKSPRSGLFPSLSFTNGDTLFSAAVSSCNTPSLAMTSPRNAHMSNNLVLSPRHNNNANSNAVNHNSNDQKMLTPTHSFCFPSLGTPFSPPPVASPSSWLVQSPSVHDYAASPPAALPPPPSSSRSLVCSSVTPSISSPSLNLRHLSSPTLALDPLEEEELEHEGDEPFSTPHTSPSKPTRNRENSDSPNKSVYYEEYEAQGF